MFSLYDKVVYPGHGVAQITRIIERVVAGQKTSYYELKFLNKDMTVLVPIENMQVVPIRPLSSKESIHDALKVLAQPARKLNVYEFTASSWNKRNKEYQVKLRAGGLRELSEIYRDLKFMEMQKDLSFGEKSLLYQTETLLAEEISFVEELDLKIALEKLRLLWCSQGYTRPSQGAHHLNQAEPDLVMDREKDRSLAPGKIKIGKM
jgi:CarD family transcriptional regulator